MFNHEVFAKAIIASKSYYPLQVVFKSKSYLDCHASNSAKEAMKQSLESMHDMMNFKDIKKLHQNIELLVSGNSDLLHEDCLFLNDLGMCDMSNILSWMLVKQQKGN